jgi:hypothetical protein
MTLKPFRIRYDWQKEPFETFFPDSLRKPQYRGNSNPWAGHCYVACEVLFHINAGRYKAYFIKHEGEPHWFLKDKYDGEIIDPTYKQFKTPVPYEKGIGKGFLTKRPSARAKVVLNSIAIFNTK